MAAARQSRLALTTVQGRWMIRYIGGAGMSDFHTTRFASPRCRSLLKAESRPRGQPFRCLECGGLYTVPFLKPGAGTGAREPSATLRVTAAADDLETATGFDLYYKWLGIPPKEKPPNYYRLLGIPLFESNADVIANAADGPMMHLRTFQTGKHAALTQRLLNEVARARVRLPNPEKRSAFDQQSTTPSSPPRKIQFTQVEHETRRAQRASGAPRPRLASTRELFSVCPTGTRRRGPPRTIGGVFARGKAR